MKLDQPTKPVIVILKPHFTAVILWHETYKTSLDFIVVDVAQNSDGSWALQNEPCGGFYCTLDQWRDAHWNISGAVKWDGCINWQTSERIMAHGCGESMISELQSVFSTVYHIGERLMPGCCDKVIPGLPEGAIELSL